MELKFSRRSHKMFPKIGQPVQRTVPLAAPNINCVWQHRQNFQERFPTISELTLVVPIGGLAMEYGDGTHSTVEPSGFLIGEDTKGQGHITRHRRSAEAIRSCALGLTRTGYPNVMPASPSELRQYGKQFPACARFSFRKRGRSTITKIAAGPLSLDQTISVSTSILPFVAFE